MPILSPVYSANQKRSCASIRLRRGDELGVGTGQNLTTFVTASMPMICEPRKSGGHGLPLESTMVRSTYKPCGPGGRFGETIQLYVPSTFLVFGSIRDKPAQIFPSGPIARNCPPTPSIVLTSSVFGLNFVIAMPGPGMRRGNQMLP